MQELEPVVIIDDDKSICKTLQMHFERQGSRVITANLAKDGIDVLKSLSSAIVILDVKLPDADGIELLKQIQGNGGDYYSIIITAFPNMDSTIKAVQNGVGEYIHKPIDIQEIDSAMEKARDFFSSKNDSKISLVPIPVYETWSDQFIGKSSTMKELFKTVGMVSMGKATVHITGESGTGKELVAKAIHQNSPEKDAPFISINCSAIVETLLESELFGHSKGSFTGAIADKEGKFALAGNGTIFLDEISEMDINLQAKLLRVLQEREFYAVGGKDRVKVNCRIISASNSDIERMVKEGKFREDLYYRLNVVNIHIPPLRARREDIPDLLLYFLAKIGKQNGRYVKYISQESIDFLTSQYWKGNVRELENVVTHVATMSREDTLSKKHFAHIVSSTPANTYSKSSSESGDNGTNGNGAGKAYSPVSLNIVEGEMVKKTLEHTKWHKGKACEILGISRPRLDRKIKKYGIKPSQPYADED